jgi:hypothetical protein
MIDYDRTVLEILSKKNLIESCIALKWNTAVFPE